jgi:hypothetical protein
LFSSLYSIDRKGESCYKVCRKYKIRGRIFIVKFKCKLNLYWVQQSGYTGILQSKLNENPKRKTTLEFEAGKEYEVLPRPSCGTCPEIIELVAVGESGKKYVVMRGALHFQATSFVTESFDFSEIGQVDGYVYSGV